jgi:phosphatidylinositol alpha-1,6-mannosyltransferase
MADPRDKDDLKAADAIIADGWAADHLPAALGRPVDHIPKGIDVDTFRPDGPDVRAQLGLTGKRVALVVSRMVPIKNVALAVEAMAIVAARHPDLVLVLAGVGPLRAAIEARAAALQLADRVIFAGAVPHRDVPAWYRAADVFVLPSEFDNSPNVALEAMASGVPVVATDVGGVRHYVQDGVNGALVPAGNAPAVADAIGRYLADPALTARTGARNRSDVVAGFSWAQSAQRLRAVYQRVIAERCGEMAAHGVHPRASHA